MNGRKTCCSRHLVMMMVIVVVCAIVGRVSASSSSSFAHSSLSSEGNNQRGSHHRVQDFTLNELHEDNIRFERTLREDGILTISLEGNEFIMRHLQGRAFEATANCLGHRDEERKESVLDDGRTKRYSLASKTSFGVSIPLIGLPSGTTETRRDCARVNAEVSPLRTMVGLVGEEVLRAMDGVLSSSSTPYVLKTRSPDVDVERFSELSRSSEQLEHYHMMVLEGGARRRDGEVEKKEEESGDAIHMHTDNGLFILMTAGHFYTSAPASEQTNRQQWVPHEAPELHHGLYVKRADGTIARAILQEQGRGRLIFMAGEAMRQWTHPSVGNAVRTVPHAVVLPKKSDVVEEGGVARLWYGRMFLPPGNAIVGASEGAITFAEYRAENVKAIAALNARQQRRRAAEMSTGVETRNIHSFVGTASFRGLTSGTCTANELWCWNQCMDSSGLSCNMHETIECSSTTSSVDCSATHDASCAPTCVSMSVDNETSNSTSAFFCTGSGTSMYMDGFNSFFSEDANTKLCVNLWFVNWTLDTEVKFAFASIGACLFGIIVEWLRSVQRALLLKKNGAHWMSILAIRAIQLTCGYFAMLIAMTYQTELFIMLIVGLTCGWGVFNMPSPGSDKDERVSAAEDTMPCCEIGDGKREHNCVIAAREKESRCGSTSDLLVDGGGGATVVPMSTSPETNSMGTVLYKSPQNL